MSTQDEFREFVISKIKSKPELIYKDLKFLKKEFLQGKEETSISLSLTEYAQILHCFVDRSYQGNKKTGNHCC